MFEMKSPWGTGKFNCFKGRSIQHSRIQNLVECVPKFLWNLYGFKKGIIYAWYRAIYIQCIDFYRSPQSVLQLHALYSLLAVLVYCYRSIYLGCLVM